MAKTLHPSFAFVASLDDDWQDPTLWPKANPNMPQAFPDGVPEWAEGMGTPKLEYLTEQAENAALNPAGVVVTLRR